MEKRQMSAELSRRVVSDPKICGGELCVAGTRIPVWVVLSHLAAGEDIETILRNFPRLTREDILAYIRYASSLAERKGRLWRRSRRFPICDHVREMLL